MIEEEDSQGSRNNDETDSQMEKKKSLIQIELIDKKYEIDEFTNYIRRIKGNIDIDLSKWSFEEIKTLINDFQRDFDKKRDQLENITINDQKEIGKDTLMSKIISGEEENEYITTIKQEKSFLSDSPILTFQITNIEKISGFLYLTSDYYFTIEIIEISSKIIRTLRDFEWFKDTIELYYPTTYIPPLPTFAYFTLPRPNYLKRKANYLKMFLSYLSQNSLIISTKLFSDFLKLKREELVKLQKDYDQSDPPTKIKKFPTMEGMLAVGMSVSKDTEAEFMKKNIESKSMTYAKLNKAIKEVIWEFSVMSGKMTKVSEAFNEIAKEHNDIPYINKVYSDFEELTRQYANSYLNQQTFFEEDLQQYFKYTNKMFKSFTTFVDDFEKAKNDYLSQYESHLTALNKRDFCKIDCLKKQYGYCLNRVYTEHKRLKKISSDSLEYHLKNLLAQKEKMFEDYLTFVSLLEGKKKRKPESMQQTTSSSRTVKT